MGLRATLTTLVMAAPDLAVEWTTEWLRWLGVAFLADVAIAVVAVRVLARNEKASNNDLRLQSVERHAVLRRAFVFLLSSRRQLLIPLAAASAVPLLVVTFIMGDAAPEPLGSTAVRWIAMTAIGLIAVLEAMLLWPLVRTDLNYLAMTEDGIEFRYGFSKTFVPWRAIEHVGEFAVFQQRMLGLALSDPDAAELGSTRWVMSLNRKTYGYDFGYPLGLLRSPPELLTRAVARYVETPQRRTAIGTEAELHALRGG